MKIYTLNCLFKVTVKSKLTKAMCVINLTIKPLLYVKISKQRNARPK